MAIKQNMPATILPTRSQLPQTTDTLTLTKMQMDKIPAYYTEMQRSKSLSQTEREQKDQRKDPGKLEPKTSGSLN